MGRLLVLVTAGLAGVGAIMLHVNHSLAVILLCAALLVAAFGLLLWVRHPLADLLEELRHHAD